MPSVWSYLHGQQRHVDRFDAPQIEQSLQTHFGLLFDGNDERILLGIRKFKCCVKIIKYTY